jgi:hypothetical protein
VETVNQGPCSNLHIGSSNSQQSSNCVFQDNPISTTTSHDVEQPPSPPLGHPRASAKFYTDKVWPDGTFAVLCDRACHVYDVCSPRAITPGAVWGNLPGRVDAVGVDFRVDFPSHFWCTVSVESEDEKPVNILAVQALVIKHADMP